MSTGGGCSQILLEVICQISPQNLGLHVNTLRSRPSKIPPILHNNQQSIKDVFSDAYKPAVVKIPNNDVATLSEYIDIFSKEHVTHFDMLLLYTNRKSTPTQHPLLPMKMGSGIWTATPMSTIILLLLQQCLLPDLQEYTTMVLLFAACTILPFALSGWKCWDCHIAVLISINFTIGSCTQA